MGMFLMLAGIAQSNADEVEAALQNYVTEKSGTFTPVDAGVEVDEDEMLLIAGSESGHVTVLFPSSILNWDEVSEHLSATLGKAVFSLHIHDGDLWMYVLFVNGREVDRFNPIPDYWEDDLPDDEMEAWAGDAAVVCHYWPSLSEEQVANYFIRWELDDDKEYEIKAYLNDEYGREDWQMLDFMKKVGLNYPLDESGHSIAAKYRFKIKEQAG